MSTLRAPPRAPGMTMAKLLPAVVAGWLAYLVLDFLGHAVLRAPWWRATESYWLPPQELFRRIPFAYASFAIYCAALGWWLGRLQDEPPSLAKGLRFGAIAGLVFGFASVLGTYSALRMPASSLLVWPGSVLLDSTAAGGAIAWVLAAPRRWPRVGIVAGAAVALFIIGVVVQNLFLAAPASSAP